MIRVGLVGEDPNDTLSIKYLLERKYKTKFKFFPLVKGLKGHQLDAAKIKKSLPIEVEDKKCKFVIYIRDLDAHKSQISKIKARIDWFKDIDAAVNSKGILLLNIWELEALILGDLETFNSLYKIQYKLTGDPMFIKEPKELLKQITAKSKKQYRESHCPDIFKVLDISKVENKCSCFSSFISQLNDK